MIRNTTQLKAKVRNLSGGDNTKALTLIRNYLMERFLERVAISKYRNNFILKGGMLVSSMVGLNTRATMDIDTTVRSLSISKENAEKVISDIIAVNIPDGITFRITKITDIMEEHDYPGIRFMLEATLEKMQQSIKIDISTDDIITPDAIEYEFPLMFEDRSLTLWSYNLETLLGEKLETIMTRGTANTRMRDFYDIHILTQQKSFDQDTLKAAFMATCEKRKSTGYIPDIQAIIETIASDKTMQTRWINYGAESFYVEDLAWPTVMMSVKQLAEKIMEYGQGGRT